MMLCLVDVKEINFRPAHHKPQMLFPGKVMQKMHALPAINKRPQEALPDSSRKYQVQAIGLPVNELKMDKSFVMGMERNESDAQIVRSTIDLPIGLQPSAWLPTSCHLGNTLRLWITFPTLVTMVSLRTTSVHG